MIGIVDYGLGNVGAFLTCLSNSNIKAEKASDPHSLSKFSHLILPGVGSFDYAIKLINKSGLIGNLYENVMIDKKPLLSVCVGMQMLATRSFENGKFDGLNWIKGEVKKKITSDINQIKKFRKFRRNKL